MCLSQVIESHDQMDRFVAEPQFARPADEKILQVYTDLATVLSTVAPDENRLRTLAEAEIMPKLEATGHSTTAIAWAIHLGIKSGTFAVTTLRQRQVEIKGPSTVGTRPIEREVPALSANERFFKAWRIDDFRCLLHDPTPLSETTTAAGKIAMCLSGGGIRATLFHLGVLIRLTESKKLDDVVGVVSVSGGSILAAHFAVRWQEAVESDESFIEVAADLVKFCRSDFRDSVLVRWLWSRLYFLWCSRSHSRTSYLEDEYQQHFGAVTLGQLSADDKPFWAFVATDVVAHEKVALSSKGVFRFPKESGIGESHPAVISSAGIKLPMAVAVSSCFPPVFRELVVEHKHIGLNYDEFKGRLVLKDGGVFDNLGIKVLLSLKDSQFPTADTFLICNAERPQVRMPAGIKKDIDALGVELSEAARKEATTALGSKQRHIRFGSRTSDPLGLSFEMQTQLHGFRTDLDAPSWQEASALLRHGAAAAAESLGEPLTDRTIELIQKVLIKAGSPDPCPAPTASELRNCNRQPIKKVIIHAVVVSLLILTILYATFSGVQFVYNLFNRSALPPLASQVSIENRPDPPEDIPSLDPELDPVSGIDRKRPEFQRSTISIVNNSDSTIILAYTYTPQSDGRERSIYGHRESSVVHPGETVEDIEESFGGPYHISIFVDGVWTKMDRWYDLKIVQNRQVVVDEATGKLRCTILFPSDAL